MNVPFSLIMLVGIGFFALFVALMLYQAFKSIRSFQRAGGLQGAVSKLQEQAAALPAAHQYPTVAPIWQTGTALTVGLVIFLIGLILIIGGLYLWRKQPLGYVAGTGLLFQASMLFVALLVFFSLQPFVAGVPFPVEDFVVILVMGSVCFIPFGLFVRGIVKTRN